MSIPFATHRISVLRRANAAGDSVDPLRESYGSAGGVTLAERATTRTVAHHVAAHIGSPSGQENRLGGDQEDVTYELVCDLFDAAGLQQDDQVLDEATGVTYQVSWAVVRQDIPRFSHVKAGLLTTRGVA